MARQPENAFHPGVLLLEEFLEPAGMTQAALAEKLGWTPTRLNELIKGKRGVTAAAALDLADVLGTSPKLWMNLQATYDPERAAKARRVYRLDNLPDEIAEAIEAARMDAAHDHLNELLNDD
jgi:addiction module HigA family antidote